MNSVDILHTLHSTQLKLCINIPIYVSLWSDKKANQGELANTAYNIEHNNESKEKQKKNKYKSKQYSSCLLFLFFLFQIWKMPTDTKFLFISYYEYDNEF